MASSASGPEKKFPVMPSRVPLDCDEGPSGDQHELGVRLPPRLGRESHFRIYFNYIGQRGDFLTRRVVQRSGRLKV